MKIGLGAVQFGVDYGISNRWGKTPEDEVAAILRMAAESGIRIIDTACLYGSSEEVLGRCMPTDLSFDIVTKTPQFNKLSIAEADAEHLEETFHASLAKLNKSFLYGLLLHRVDDLLTPGGELLMERMVELKRQGLVGKIGVSVYSARQIDEVLSRFHIDMIQLPLNVLDQRLLKSGHLGKLKRVGVEIHVRSVFLQGLLLMGLQEVPDYFDGIRDRLEAYHRSIRGKGLRPIQAALGFVAGVPEIDCVICGVNNRQQLREICEAARVETQPEEYVQFAIENEAMVNPALWRLEEK